MYKEDGLALALLDVLQLSTADIHQLRDCRWSGSGLREAIGENSRANEARNCTRRNMIASNSADSFRAGQLWRFPAPFAKAFFD